ncbi:MAG: S8 family serine peptidase [Myxococcota bacterium]|nr:S8 family serine peptidase [Myxococcota bacterium]
MGCLDDVEETPIEEVAPESETTDILKARVPMDKFSRAMSFLPAEPDRLVVKFNEGTGVKLASNRLISRAPRGLSLPVSAGVKNSDALLDELAVVEELLSKSNLSFSPLFTQGENVLDRLKTSGEQRSGKQLADLTLYYAIPSSAFSSPIQMTKLRDALNQLNSVEGAYIQPKSGLPAAPTRDYSGDQTYTKPAANGGVDADYAAGQPGGRGAGVKIIDVEKGWNVNHEDFPPLFYPEDTATLPDDVDGHGTAVMGIIGGVVNKPKPFGVTGIAADAQFGCSILGRIMAAIDQLRPGDVLLLEVHRMGPVVGDCDPASGNCNWIPIEFWQADFDAVEIARSNGIIVVAAAGNGTTRLDHRYYGGLFDRQVRDSGAIIVGASYPNPRQPVNYSNSGTRVDVHSWGDMVVTMGGNGDLKQNHEGENDKYTQTFGGTSSAAAIVAGVVTAMQGVAKAELGEVLSPGEMRALLTATGTPQTAELDRPIGPQPDMRAAINVLYNRKPIADFSYKCRNKVCNFIDLSTDTNSLGSIVGWNWDFGDGAGSNEKDPSHTFAEDGTYTITLVVTDDNNNSSVALKRLVKTDTTNCPFEYFYAHTVTASSEDGEYVASHVIDREQGTTWQSGANDSTPTLVFDLGIKRKVEQVVINWWYPGTTGFDIDMSNTGINGPWTNVYSDNDVYNDRVVVDIPDVVASRGRFLRLRSKGPILNWKFVTLEEVSFYGQHNADCGAFSLQYVWNMDSEPGWIPEGQWSWGQPAGQGGKNVGLGHYGEPDPDSGYTGNNVYGYNLAGNYGNYLKEEHLTTTAIDCSGLTDVTLKFQRWLNVERSRYDHAHVRVSNDGIKWIPLWSNPYSPHVTDSVWQLQEFDISTHADNQPTVYLRWTMGTTDQGWQYSGWNIDDVEIWAISNDSVCQVADDCNDLLFCNGVEDCVNNRCVDGTPEDCNDLVDCTIDSCDDLVDTCKYTPDHWFCMDTEFCNGPESCSIVEGRCVDGEPPCALELCNETDNTCIDPCSYDEDSDGDNDVVHQPGTSPPVCWRRCPIPQDWNGTACVGNAETFTQDEAANACMTIGNYHLPTVDAFKEILDPCAASGENWDCTSCPSSLCGEMFFDTTYYYWTDTPHGVDRFYRADFDGGSIKHMYKEMSVYRARCVLN